MEDKNTGFKVTEADIASKLKNRAYMVVQEPKGIPVLGEDVLFVETEIPKVKEGEFLIRHEFLSVDPYHRGMLNSTSYGRKNVYPRVMHGQVIGRVVENNGHPDIEVGDHVLSYGGYQDYSATSFKKGAKKIKTFSNDEKTLSQSLSLGSLGMPGATAYHGFLDICQPKEGETVAVSAASGAVGSIVGQIAKVKGCRVIGFAGSDEKCKYVVESLGFDVCINYVEKSEEELTKELKDAAPKGIDCYFDNTGGVITDAVINNINLFGRLSICGQIAYYNLEEAPKTKPLTFTALRKQLKIQGFIISSLSKDWSKAHAQLAEWILNGDIKVREDITNGLDKAFTEGFLSLFRGYNKSSKVNFGKKLIKL